MSSDTHSHAPDRDPLRAQLSRLAARLTLDPDEQRRLVDQTIGVVLDDPDFLDTADVDGALERVMQRLTSIDTSTSLISRRG